MGTSNIDVLLSMKNSNANQFVTADFYVSAFLLAKGVKLLNVNRENGRKLEFIFSVSTAKQRLVNDFWLGQGSVEPKRYAAAIKDLKALIYSVHSE